MRICLVGDSQDLTATYIGWLADRRGVGVVRLEEASLGIDWAFSFDDLKSHAGSIETSGSTISVSEISGVFVRLNPDPGVASELELDSDEIGALSVERRHALHFLLNTLSCVVVNRPYSGRSNGSKPHQMRLLEDAGFVVPKWLVSNDSGAVLEFVRRYEHPPIVKSCSGLRSKVRLFDSVVTGRLREGTSPIVVQEYIDGFDVRAHVVDGRLFSTKVT
jgi:glutathione synthase/RimK-type ligase-like ATP-grasp enzyme